MRIAFLVNSFPPPTVGGAGRIAELQVSMLRDAGHEVAVFKPDMGWLEMPAWIRALRHLMDLIPNQDLVRHILAFRPDVLVTHNLTGAGFATPAVIKNQGSRWVHVLHDVQLFEPSGQLKNPQPITLWQKLWANLRGRAMGKPDLVCSPTAWLLEEHRRRGLFLDSDAAILPNPGPEPAFALRMPRRPMHLLYVGRVSKDKGSDVLVALAKELGEEATLDVIGSGPAADRLAEAANIRLLGQREPSFVREAMLEADILLVPSRIAENQPTVVLEAMAVGLPAIASPVGGVRETLSGAGRLADPHDPGVWVQAIQELRDPEAYRDAAAAMYEAARRHEPGAYRDQLLSLIENR